MAVPPFFLDRDGGILRLNDAAARDLGNCAIRPAGSLDNRPGRSTLFRSEGRTDEVRMASGSVYRFCFGEGDHVTLAKRYRRQVIETGRFVSLREKIARLAKRAGIQLKQTHEREGLDAYRELDGFTDADLLYPRSDEGWYSCADHLCGSYEDVVEAVVAQDSLLADRTVAQVRLYDRYEVSLLAVSRAGRRITQHSTSRPWNFRS